MGYTGTFGERGNVRQEICIAGRKKSLQAGGSIFRADLSSSKLEQ
ncbi:hypothetical protein HMPREF1989_00256 [Porphyromonas gingivalis F0566]|nr:hypothetical protein HMPREF1989_00256 [Porphyromonas gingivalis F0566]